MPKKSKQSKAFDAIQKKKISKVADPPDPNMTPPEPERQTEEQTIEIPFPPDESPPPKPAPSGNVKREKKPAPKAKQKPAKKQPDAHKAIVWATLNDRLMRSNLEEAKEMFEEERSGRARVSYLRRIASRARRLDYARTLKEIADLKAI